MEGSLTQELSILFLLMKVRQLETVTDVQFQYLTSAQITVS